MQSLLLLASSGKGDPAFGIFLGVGAVALLAIGIYALIKWKVKADSKIDEDWRKAAEILGFENLSVSRGCVMEGNLDGRDVSVALRFIEVLKVKWTRPVSVQHLFCQVSFSRPLGNQFSIEPSPVYLWQMLGGDDTNIPGFDKLFKVVTADLDRLNGLLMAPPETMDGRVLADDLLDRMIQKGQRICLTESALELAIKATDTSSDLAERVRDLAEETIGLADLIERRAHSASGS